MARMKRKVNDGKDEEGGRPQPQDRRSPQPRGHRRCSGRGYASPLSRLKMLERRYQVPVRTERLEKS